MAKGRMINRTIATDKNVNSLKVEDQWLFMRMLPFIDDEGRMTGNIFEFKYQIIPSSNWSEEHIRNSLNRIVTANLIYFIENQAIQFRGFFKNQKIGHKPAKSLYPNIIKDGEIAIESLTKVSKESNNIIEANIKESNSIKSKRSYKDTPQDLKMVIDYFKELKIVSFKSNAERFYNYYETNGWVQGASKKPIKSWKACVRTWDFEKDDTTSVDVEKVCPVYHHEDGHDKRKVGSKVTTHCKKCRSMLVSLSEWQIIQVQEEHHA